MSIDLLTDRETMVLEALHALQATTRRDLAHTTGLEVNQVSLLLHRLKGYGYANPGANPGDWSITDRGNKRARQIKPNPSPIAIQRDQPMVNIVQATVHPPQPARDMPPVPNAEPTLTESIAMPGTEATATPDLDRELDAIVARLRRPDVPAQAARVYRQIHDALPASIQAALAPITAVVNAYP